MGYQTHFSGSFEFDRPLDLDTWRFLSKLNDTRRMKRNLGPEYGIEGEFYVDGDGFKGQGEDDSIVDFNEPPSTQPGLWCQWVPDETGKSLIWDGGEKFYNYVEWLEYIIEKVLIPKGYLLNGEVRWQGEDPQDRGTIRVEDNMVHPMSEEEYVSNLEMGLQELIKTSRNAALSSPNPVVRDFAKAIHGDKNEDPVS